MSHRSVFIFVPIFSHTRIFSLWFLYMRINELRECMRLAARHASAAAAAARSSAAAIEKRKSAFAAFVRVTAGSRCPSVSRRHGQQGGRRRAGGGARLLPRRIPPARARRPARQGQVLLRQETRLGTVFNSVARLGQRQGQIRRYQGQKFKK
jgi:hypothetical protein